MFVFEPKGTFLQSIDEIPEPHEFKASLRLAHGDHGHTYDVEFHEHDHGHAGDVNSAEYQDAHERAHASDIQKRFTNRNVTTGQVVLFGLTGGLIPCPAAVTVLLLCLQLKEIPLGAVLVLCFSIGLAITLVSVGTVAALGVKHASTRFTWLSSLGRRAPYASGLLIIAVGLYVGIQGWVHLPVG